MVSSDCQTELYIAARPGANETAIVYYYTELMSKLIHMLLWMVSSDHQTAMFSWNNPSEPTSELLAESLNFSISAVLIVVVKPAPSFVYCPNCTNCFHVIYKNSLTVKMYNICCLVIRPKYKCSQTSYNIHSNNFRIYSKVVCSKLSNLTKLIIQT